MSLADPLGRIKPRELRDLYMEARRLGCEVVVARGGHVKVSTPHGPVFGPSSGGDRLGWKRTRQELIRHGVPLG